MVKKIIVGLSGSSGSILGIRLLEKLKKLGVETHLVVTDVAKKVISGETKYTFDDVKKLANKTYEIQDFFAPIASGSFKTDGMIVIPCSMKTLAGVANGYSSNLLLRTADVMLKEKRKLVLVTREMPLSYIHLKDMEIVALAGGVVLPPMLTFYNKPEKIDDLIDHVIGKALDQLDLEIDYKRWK